MRAGVRFSSVTLLKNSKANARSAIVKISREWEQLSDFASTASRCVGNWISFLAICQVTLPQNCPQLPANLHFVTAVHQLAGGSHEDSEGHPTLKASVEHTGK